MAGVVSTLPAGVNVTPSVATHDRATVTNVAAALDTLLSGGKYPTLDGRNPTAVYLGVEPGAGDVYVTWDGASTPSATLGFKCGSNASPLYIPVAPGLEAGQIQVVASINPTYLQVKCEFEGR